MTGYIITDDGNGEYLVRLRHDPNVVRKAMTYGMAEAYGHEMVQDMQNAARAAIYEKIDDERALEEASALLKRKPGRPRKVVIVEEDEAPAPARIEGAPVDEDATS